MLKKIVIGALAALVLLYPALAWLTGSFIEHRFDSSIAQMREATPYITVIEHHFHRGWYTSQDELTVEVLHDVLAALPNSAAAAPSAAPIPAGAAVAPYAPWRITLRSIIRHGPICGLTCYGLARVDSRVVFTDRIQSAISQVFGSNEPVTIRSRLGFFGGGSSEVASPAIADATLADGAHVGWGGIEATLSYSANGDSGAMQAAAPRILYSDADGKRFELSAAQITSHSKRLLRSLHGGSSSFSIGRVGFAGPGGTGGFTLDDLRFTSEVDASRGFMTMNLKAGTGLLTTKPLTLNGIHFDFTLRHLEMESLERLTSGIQKVNADLPLPPAERSAKILAVLKTQGGSLLAQRPQITVDRLSFSNAGGTALITGLVQLPDVTAADFAPDADPKAIIRKIDAQWDLTLDEAFLKSLPGAAANGAAQLQALADRGLFTHESGSFRTKILFRGGRATFNGIAFPSGGPPASQSITVPPPSRPPH